MLSASAFALHKLMGCRAGQLMGGMHVTQPQQKRRHPAHADAMVPALTGRHIHVSIMGARKLHLWHQVHTNQRVENWDALVACGGHPSLRPGFRRVVAGCAHSAAGRHPAKPQSLTATVRTVWATVHTQQYMPAIRLQHRSGNDMQAWDKHAHMALRQLVPLSCVSPAPVAQTGTPGEACLATCSWWCGYHVGRGKAAGLAQRVSTPPHCLPDS
jgi:hypothetical protein